MQILSPTVTWLVFSCGVTLATVGAYILGRLDAKRRTQDAADTWVVTVDHGIFGLELESRFRSRSNAENRRRHLVGLEEKAGVIHYSQWLKIMTTKVHSPVYWDGVMHVRELFESMNAELDKLRAVPVPESVETTILPVIDDLPLDDGMNRRLDDIATGVGVVAVRAQHADEILNSLTDQMTAFQNRMIALEQKMDQHNAKVGHVTAEMDLIREAAPELAVRPDFKDAQHRSESSRRLGGAARTLISPRGMEELRSYHEHRLEALESRNKIDEDRG